MFILRKNIIVGNINKKHKNEKMLIPINNPLLFSSLIFSKLIFSILFFLTKYASFAYSNNGRSAFIESE